MGLMDKVKQQAEQALTKAQQGVAQGQAKLDEVQTKRQADALLRDLGAAYFSAERENGSREDVSKALGAVDEHIAAHGPLAPAAPAPGGDSAAPGSPAGPAGSSATSGTPAGDYSLGDL